MKLSMLVAVVGLLCLSSLAQAQSPSKPNILFLFADDWGRYASIYPTIDGRAPLTTWCVRLTLML